MKKIGMYLFAGFFITALASCGGGSNDSDLNLNPNPNPNPNPVATGSGTVSGLVTDTINGKRLANVKVIAGDKETTTDGNGEFEISGLANKDYVIGFQKTDYAPGYSNVSVADKTETILLSLKKEGVKQDYDAATEATIFEDTISGPYAVIFQPDSLDTTDTNLKVSVTPLDPTIEADALPGQLETETAMLVPLTFAEFSIFDTAGNKVNLKAGKEAIVELPIPVSLRNLPEYGLSKTIHCYSYNPVTGQWEDFVVGTVVKSSVDGITPVVRASIKHFSWYGAAPQSSECIDIYGQVISAATGNPLPFARVEAFPGSATTSDANGLFRLATAATGSPKITASRTYVDVDGSISGTVGSSVIEYGSVADVLLVGLVTRPCSDAPGSNPSGGSSTESGSQNNPVILTIGNLGKVSYVVDANLFEGTAFAILKSNIADSNFEGGLISGAKMVLTSSGGSQLVLTEDSIFPGQYSADLEAVAGQRYTLTIDADDNGTIDGSGSVFMTGEVSFVGPAQGSTVSNEALTISWADSAYTAGAVDSNYAAMYWVWITGTDPKVPFSFDSANYLGTGLSFVAKSNINEGENLKPGNYSALIWGSSGAYVPGGSGFDSTIVNNITGPSVSGRFYVYSFSTESVSFTVQ